MTLATGDPDDLGERLATWLDGLELGGHLSEAGLPTYERDGGPGAGGQARWIDPVTGEPLAHDQLEQLDRMLRSQGDEPDHAVPLPLLQLARQARVRAELLAEPWFTYESLAEVRGASVDATRFAVHKAAGDHRLLVLAEGARTLVPAFQLTTAGDPRPELAPVVTPLLAAGMDPWRAWAWLTRPVALLGGLVPEVAVTDPETADLVPRAAVHLAERVATSRR